MIVKRDKKEARRKTLLKTHKVAEKFLNHEIGITQVSVRLDQIKISGATKIINKIRIDKKFQEIETYNGNLHSKHLPSNSTRTNFRHQINITNKQVRANFLSKTPRFPKLSIQQIHYPYVQSAPLPICVSTTHMCNQHQKYASNVDIPTT